MGGLIRLDPGAAGRGLSFGLHPVWGAAESGVERLWTEGVTGRAPADDGEPAVPQGRLDATLGYGLSPSTAAGC